MQQPLPRVRPLPSPGLDQRIDRDMPDIGLSRRGWYPRWWLLSAFFCGLLIGVFYLLGRYAICTTTTSSALLCQVNTWTDWRQGMVIVSIWLVFALGWFVAYVFGLGPLEIPGKRGSGLATFFRAISDFGPIYIPLMIYGVLAFCSIVVTWFLGYFQPVPFAIASIVVFVANCSFLYRRSQLERRGVLVGYAILALFGILLMVLLNRLQWFLFFMEIVIVFIGVWALWSIFRLQPLSSRQLTPQEELDAAIARTISPRQVFMDLIRSIFRNQGRGNNPANPDLQQPPLDDV